MKELSRKEANEILWELPMCACGTPEEALAEFKAVLEILALRKNGTHDWEESWKKLEQFVPGRPGLIQILLHALENADLIGHGTSSYGSWLEERGEEFLDALNRMTYDEIAGEVG